MQAKEKSLPNDLFIHSPFWALKLESLSNAVAIRMAQDLDKTGILGIGDAAKPFWKGFKHDCGKTDSNIDFLLRVKKIHPQKIVLVQIGEFYETWGLDSIFLVEHCGINRMGRKGPRAGMPLANIQNALDDLTQAGFAVVVCEQAEDFNKKARKVRFISEIITPSSPTYTYGLAMSHKVNICFPEAPPEFGIAANSKGILMVEINPDLRTTLILEGLTEEAALIRLNKYSGRLNRVFLHDKLPKSLQHSANLKFQNLINIQGYTARAFATRMEELIKIDLALDAKTEFFKTQATRFDNCPFPLYQNTAEQIGILPKRGIPDLVQLMLPKGSPATCKYILRNILLTPPSKNYATCLRQTIIELQNAKKLPILIVSNPVRYIKTLNKSEAHPEILKDLFCLAEIFLNCKENLSDNFIENSLEIVSYISSIKAQSDVLKNASKKIIATLASILPKEEDFSHTPTSELIPAILFERIEEEFRGRIASTASAEIAKLYDDAKKAAKKYEECLNKKLLCVVESDEEKKSKKIALSYDMHNQAIWLAGSISAKAIEQHKLIRPIDRYNKEVKDRFTTKEVEEALKNYKEIAQKTYEEIRKILKKASQELAPYCLPIIHLATFSNLVKTLYLHIKECKTRNWTINFVEVDKNNSHNSNEIEVSEFFPYWMKDDAAVKNSLNFSGTCLLTGHNMAGKSTLIRSLAATTLLGSCGFMFPAAGLKISQEIDGWYVRTGASDDPENNLSAFGVEMTDIKVALRDATKKSLLFIDELGKGTESKAGHAIAASVLEHLAKKNIRSIFATHWHEIFVNKTINLENIHLIKMHCDGDVASYKVVKGVDLNSSAFYTATQIGVDDEIIARAKEIATGYESIATRALKPDELFFGEEKSANFEYNFSTKNLSLKNSNFIKEILLEITKNDFCEIKNLKANEMPPLNDIGHSIVYILKTENNFFYAGETDNFLNRAMAHRQNFGANCEFFYTHIKNGKSQARKIEQKLISRLKDEGFVMLSVEDERNLSFAS